MRIQKFGHSCLSVTDGKAAVLIDPGSFSTGFEELTGLTAILVTHVHDDHVDADRTAALVRNNPDARVYAEQAAAAKLTSVGVEVTTVGPGESFDVGVPVQTFGGEHAIIHADLPCFGNVGFLVGGRLFHPGDSLQVPDAEVEILAVPVMAPWMAMKEAIDFERAVGPKASIPIHDALLSVKGLYYDRLAQMGPADLRWLDLDSGEPVDL